MCNGTNPRASCSGFPPPLSKTALSPSPSLLISPLGSIIETHAGAFYANSSLLVEAEFIPVCRGGGWGRGERKKERKDGL